MRFNDSTDSVPSQLDFFPRERRNQIWSVVIAFSISIALIFVLGYGIGHSYRIFAPLFAMGVVCALCLFVVFSKQRNLDLVMSTEYQNMMFAQAASLGGVFCMFVRRDGTIVYANEGLRKVFKDFMYSESQALEGLFERGGVAKPDRERIMNAIFSHSSERHVFPIKGEDGAVRTFVLTVEPLLRPSGYAVIRGREFNGERAGLQVLPDMLRSTSAEKINHMLATTPVAHYITNNFGEFEYVNAALEQMLGYETGALVESKYTIQKLLATLNQEPLSDDFVLSDLSAQATFLHRSGREIRGMLFQSVQRNESGKLLSASGSVLPA